MSFMPPTVQPSDDTIRANVKMLFTVQERTAISDLISRGHIDHVGAAIDPENPERAYWLNEYLKMKKPANLPEELSAVRKELMHYEAKFGLDSPEKAAFWEKRLQMERDGIELPPLEEAMKDIQVNKDSSSDIVETAEVEKNTTKRRGRPRKEDSEIITSDVSDAESVV